MDLVLASLCDGQVNGPRDTCEWKNAEGNNLRSCLRDRPTKEACSFHTEIRRVAEQRNKTTKVCRVPRFGADFRRVKNHRDGSEGASYFCARGRAL